MTQCILVALRVQFYALCLSIATAKMNACRDTDWNVSGRAPAHIWSYCVSLRATTNGYKRVLSAVRCWLSLTPLLQPRLTMELIPYWNPTGSRLVQKLPSFSGTRTSSTVFTIALRFLHEPKSKKFTSYFLIIYFNIIFQSTPLFSKRCLSLDFPIKTPYPFYVFPNVPSHPPYFIHRSNIWWWAQIMTTPRF